MFRKTIVAVTAILAVSLMAPTEASAFRGGFGGWHGGFGGWHGGWRGGWGGWGWGAAGLGIGLGLAATAPYWAGYPYGYYPYGYANYYGYGGCYIVRQRIWTSHGWRWRPVQVCG